MQQTPAGGEQMHNICSYAALAPANRSLLRGSLLIVRQFPLLNQVQRGRSCPTVLMETLAVLTRSNGVPNPGGSGTLDPDEGQGTSRVLSHVYNPTGPHAVASSAVELVYSKQILNSAACEIWCQKCIHRNCNPEVAPYPWLRDQNAVEAHSSCCFVPRPMCDTPTAFRRLS